MADVITSPHNHSGNCSANQFSCVTCGLGILCDTCHKHDEPRGECSECQLCPACMENE